MAIPKVLGTETEFGIAAVGVPDFNPVLSSSLLISTFAGSLRRIRWDYEQESPLRDARGFEPIPSREVSDEDLPNTTNPDDWARISGKKGERIVYVRTLLGDEGDGRQVERVSPGQYL